MKELKGTSFGSKVASSRLLNWVFGPRWGDSGRLGVAGCEGRRLSVLVGLVAAALLVLAEPVSAKKADGSPFERYAHRVFDQDIGLPETLVAAMARTPDGYLWLGTRKGLVRFDGLKFRRFSSDDTPALRSDWINTLFTDRDGRLWIGTLGGLTVLEGGRFRQPALPPELASNSVTAIFQDRAGTIWLGTDAGVLTLRDGNVRRVGGSDVAALSFGEDGAGRLWVGAADRLLVLRRHGLVPMPADSGGLAIPVTNIVSDGSGGLWFAARGVIRHLALDSDGHPRLDSPVRLDVDGATPAVSALALDGSGRLWIGTPTHGVAVLDRGRLDWYQADRGLSSLEVKSLLIDPRQRVWVGTGLALDLFQPTAFTTYSYDDGFPRSLIWSTARLTGRQLVAVADNGGLYRFDGQRATNLVPPLAPDNGPRSLMVTRRAEVLYATGEGRVSLRTLSGGVEDLTARFRLPTARIYAMLEDRAGAFWFTTAAGVFRAVGSAPAASVYRLPTSEQPRLVAEDPGGAIWFARPFLHRLSAGRMTSWARSEGLTDARIQALFLRGGNVWIGTADSGLFVLRGNRIFSFGRLDRRLRSEVGGITEDDFGNLWLTSSYGLLRIPRHELESLADGGHDPLSIRSFDRLDGLPTTEFNSDFHSSITKDTEGHLWLPSYVGVVRVDPERVAADSEPPQVHIERLVVDGNEYSIRSTHRFEPGVGRVEIEFAATDALIPKRVRIQYKLDGRDQEWIEAGDRRVATFGPLAGGTYRFLIRAANEDGRWSMGTVDLRFAVALSLSEQPWFLPVAVLSLVLAGIALYWIRTRRIRQRSADLSRLVDDRTRDLEAARETLERRVDERTAQLKDELAERKRLQHQLVQAQKIESIGRLAGGVAHEINNMMTGVLGFAEMAEEHAKDHPVVLQDLRQIRIAGERAAQVTRQLLTFARRQAATRSTVDITDLVRTMERFLGRILGESIDLRVRIDEDLPSVAGDASQLEQLLVNLAMNAKDAILGQGTVTIAAEAVSLVGVRQVGSFELLPGDYVRLSVTDSGTGIPAEVKARLFEPFYTTKDVNRGSGLGLAVCWGVASQHGGAIGVESEPGKGSRFEVYLPTGMVTDERPITQAAPAGLPSGKERVLVVEDEQAVRLVACRTLQSLGYQVVEATDGADALEKWEAERGRIDLVLSDVVMPRMGGVELVTTLRARQPSLKVVMMSGYAGKDLPFDGSIPLLEKPFTRAALAELVRQELNRDEPAPAPA